MGDGRNKPVQAATSGGEDGFQIEAVEALLQLLGRARRTEAEARRETASGRIPAALTPEQLQEWFGRERYVVGEVLAAGGMATVYLAADLHLCRSVAYKMAHPTGSGTDASRFIYEAQVTAQLQHPSIIPISDCGIDPLTGRPFFTMPFVQGRTALDIVIGLRKFTRDDDSISGDADLVEIVTRARRMVGHQLGPDLNFNLTGPEVAVIRGNPNQLVQVFINFFQNSIDAIQQRIQCDGGVPGCIDVAVNPAGGGWEVSVRDNGIGITAENLPKIFDPFFTSKDVGKGMGLGLSIIHRILRSHKALIEVDSRAGEYACFRTVFPQASFGETPDAAITLDPSTLEAYAHAPSD